MGANAIGKTLVLVVEDEHPIAELIKFTLRSVDCQVAAVHSVREAWEFIAHRPPQLVLLDWMLPDESGLALLSRMRAEQLFDKVPIIMLTARSMEEDMIASLDRGAEDYITKPFSPRELAARVDAALRRGPPERSLAILSLGPVAIDPSTLMVSVDGRAIDIGHAEVKLLNFLLAHPERVFSRGQLLDKVWGHQIVMEERSVDAHVLRLRRALGNASHMVKTVRSVGYMLSACAPTHDDAEKRQYANEDRPCPMTSIIAS
ncbi:response regulator [Massilia glaciei]|uniref:DNA-binding response regulator n=1 Tax=Massilia glaciei TaxID=1524097 RepID=A0A2U2HDQ1_9BURK|nr:response regulator [Massilia glaciei]PWF41310.1 DNA-binding response regulator [Massilia glaciei]